MKSPKRNVFEKSEKKLYSKKFQKTFLSYFAHRLHYTDIFFGFYAFKLSEHIVLPFAIWPLKVKTHLMIPKRKIFCPKKY